VRDHWFLVYKGTGVRKGRDFIFNYERINLGKEAKPKKREMKKTI